MCTMVASRMGIVFTLIQVLLAISTAVLFQEGEDLDRIAQHVDALCPYNVICRESDPRLQVPRSGRNHRTGCCTDCSCADDCGLQEDCCYPQLDRYRLVDRKHQKCINPTTAQLKEGTAYNMVVDEYPDGTVDECEDTGTKCGDDQTATRLGALYPVFSPKTGRIYANMKCARCHGLNDDDVIVWKAYLACEDSKFIDVSTYFQYFEDGITTPSCTFRFVYPGPLSDLQTEKCHRITNIGTCVTNGFKVPDGLNMTHDEIREACNSNFTSPLRWDSTWFKNVFCRICHVTKLRYLPLLTCPKSEDIDNQRDFETSFLALIAPEALNVNKVPARISSESRTACRLTNDTDCRLAYCPSGKMPDAEGKCKYVSESWKTGAVGLYLKLIPRQPIGLFSVKNTDFANVVASPTLSVSPWPKVWTLERLMVFPRTDAKNVTQVEYFLATLKFKKDTLKAKPVLSGIENFLKRDWLLSLNDSLLAHRQEFSEYTKFVERCNSSQRISCPEIIYMKHADNSPSFVESMLVPDFEILYSVDHVKPFSIVVTKMFFCDQVLLKPGEYQMDFAFNVLQLNSTGKVFYPSEIAIAYDESGLRAPKMCSKDIGFRIASPSAGVARSLDTCVWRLLLVSIIYVG